MQRYEYATDCKWLTALKLNEIAADVRSSKLDMWLARKAVL